MKKNIVKRISVTVLALGLTVGCLAGCGKKESGSFDTSKDVTVISREDGSGTRGAFIEITGVEEKDKDGKKVDMTTDEAIISNSTNDVITTVEGNEYSIGYISLGSLNDTVKAVKVEGVEATAANVSSGKYTVQRPFNIATKGEPSEEAQDFINYIMSSDGQKIIEDNKYIKVSDNAAYKNSGAKGDIVVGGSSSVSPVMEKLIEAYMKVSDVKVTLQTSDSSTGMSSTIEGSYDIGMASRELKDSETEKGLVPIVIAKDGIAVIVNKDNTTEDLTKDQIKAIFKGETKTWADVTK